MEFLIELHWWFVIIFSSYILAFLSIYFISSTGKSASTRLEETVLNTYLLVSIIHFLCVIVFGVCLYLFNENIFFSIIQLTSIIAMCVLDIVFIIYVWMQIKALPLISQ